MVSPSKRLLSSRRFMRPGAEKEATPVSWLFERWRVLTVEWQESVLGMAPVREAKERSLESRFLSVGRASKLSGSGQCRAFEERFLWKRKGESGQDICRTWGVFCPLMEMNKEY